jgi:hypothetical protein
MPGQQSTVIEPEVLPPIGQSAMRFDMKSMVQSPFFWFILGGATVATSIWLIHREGRKQRQ